MTAIWNKKIIAESDIHTVCHWKGVQIVKN